MTASVQQNPQGPIWPLGLIVVPTPGTPVSIMSLVDASGVNDPNKPTTTTSGGVATVTAQDEYTRRAYAILITPCKAGVSHGTAVNTGNIYVLKRGAVGSGTNNRDDTGSMIMAIPQGAATTPVLVQQLDAAPLNRNVFNPYDILIDADNANDGALVCLLIQ